MGRRRRRRSQRGIPAFALVLVAIGIAAALASRLIRDVPHPVRTHHVAHPAATAASTFIPAEPAAAGATESASAMPSPAAAATHHVVPSAAPSSSSSPAAPKLAIIIDDCGQWRDTERAFVALPVALTLSVLPNVRYTADIAREASAAGKGVMLHLPMEPRSGKNSGPGEVTTAMDDAAIATQVGADIDAVPLASGVNNHEGSAATADDRVMRDVVGVLAERHLFFIDSRTTATTVAERDAGAAGVPTARRDVFLDDVAEVPAIEGQLRRAAAIAQERGSAIAIGHPRPSTLEAVRALLPELQQAGIEFVLAGDLVH